jgi:superoxide reductase
MKELAVFRCEHCGNMVIMVHNGGGTLTCCGSPMTRLEANTVDASHEKHVPAITKEDGKIKVQIGSVLHPSLPEHHIEWIVLKSGDKVQIQYIGPGVEPKAEFENVESGTVYEYCNIHGLWRADF